jgi:endonuclease III
MTLKQCAQSILKIFRNKYTRTPGDFVHWKSPLQLVVGTILSAQCTDKRVNIVTKELFKKYKTAQDFADAKLPELEKEIRSTGFYRVKARHLKGVGEILVRDHDGRVPRRLEDLLKLPGVARKTGHLVMAKLYGKGTGVAVDTHVMRLSRRMGLTKHKSQDKIESSLNELFAPKDYLDVNEFMILHGRAVCRARSPKCDVCPVSKLCPKIGTKFGQYNI